MKMSQQAGLVRSVNRDDTPLKASLRKLGTTGSTGSLVENPIAVTHNPFAVKIIDAYLTQRNSSYSAIPGSSLA